jgi:hypothetical protein
VADREKMDRLQINSSDPFSAKPMNSGGSSSFWFHKGDTPGWRTQIDVSASLHVFVRVAAVAASPLRADYS